MVVISCRVRNRISYAWYPVRLGRSALVTIVRPQSMIASGILPMYANAAIVIYTGRFLALGSTTFVPQPCAEDPLARLEMQTE